MMGASAIPARVPFWCALRVLIFALGLLSATAAQADHRANLSISGFPSQGQLLRVENVSSVASGHPPGGTLTYGWFFVPPPPANQNSTFFISGATSRSYRPTQAEVGNRLGVSVTYRVGGSQFLERIRTTTLVADANVGGTVTNPFINGIFTQGNTLEFTFDRISDDDGLPPDLELTYQWFTRETFQSPLVPIPGATNKTYMLTQAEVGRVVGVLLTYTDAENNRTPQPRFDGRRVTNVNDPPTGELRITGSALVGRELTADTASLGDIDGLPDESDFNYQWRADGQDIADATRRTFTLTPDQTGALITLSLGYTDRQNTDESLTSRPRGPVRDGTNSAPTISGTPPTSVVQGRTYSFAPTAVDADGDPLTFRLSGAPAWLSLNPDTGELTGRPGNDDVGTTTGIVIEVTDRIASPVELPPFDLEVINANDPPSGLAISGTPREDQTLTADTSALVDIDGLPPESAFSYQWRADGVDIANATGRRYRLTQAEVDKVITLILRYTDVRGGDNTATSPPTAPVVNVNDPTTGSPVVIGDYIQGRPLTIDTSGLMDEDGLGTFTYQWQRSGGDNAGFIDGATGRTYTPTQADVNHTVFGRVTHTDLLGGIHTQLIAFPPLDSGINGIVTNINDLPTGELRISGVLLVGQTLGADTSALVDIDGLPAESEFSYQWRADGVDIANATGPEYPLTAANIGARISLNLQYRDAFGADESITSPARGPVRAAGSNTPPTITGTPPPLAQVGVAYSFLPGGGDADGDALVYAITVTPDWAEFNPTTGALTGTPGNADVGTTTGIVIDVTDDIIAAPVELPAFALTVNAPPTGEVIILDSGRPTLGQVLTADASGLGDANGLPEESGFSYQWFADGAPIRGANLRTYTPDEAGEVIFVIVSYTDDDGVDEGVSSASIRVLNQLPTADAGPNQSLSKGTEVRLDGSGSSGSEGASLTYLWSQVDGTTVTLSSATAAQPTFTMPNLIPTDAPDSLTFSLVVSDGQASSTNEATVRIFIRPLFREAIADQTYNRGNEIDDLMLPAALTQEGTSGDVYALSSVPAGLSFDPATRILSGTPTVPGMFGLTYTLTTADGGTDTLEFSITITAFNNPPTTSGITVDIAEDDTFIFSVADFPFADADADIGDSLQAVRITRLPFSLRGSLALDGVAVVTNQIIEVGDIGTLVFTPVANISFDPDENVTGSNTASLSYQVSDGKDFSAVNRVIFRVTSVNDLPTITSTPAASLAQVGVAYSFTPGGGDADGHTLTYTISGAPGWLSFNPATGSLTGTPGNADVGTTTGIVIGVTDGIITAPVELAFALTVNAPPTGAVTIAGILVIGEELTADTSALGDANGLPAESTFTYQWLANGEEIPGATRRAYTLTLAERNRVITLLVRYTDDDGTAERVTSAPTAAVTVANSAPTIGGTPVTRVAQDSAYSFTPVGMDADGHTLTYTIDNRPAWALFNPATGALTGTPTNDDVGTTTGIVIGVTDGIIAAPVELPAFDLRVTNVNDAPTGAVTIAGILVIGEELTADTSALRDADGLPAESTFRYRWLADGVSIPGATGRTYSLTAAQVGANISLRLSYFDRFFTAERVTSTPRGPVVSTNEAPTIGGTPATRVAEDSEYSFTPEGGDADGHTLETDGHTLTYTIDNRPAWADFNPATGALTGTPGNDDVGTTTGIVISVTDGIIAAPVSLPAFFITVINTNDLPTGAVTIAGNLILGEELTADTSALADDDGLPDPATFTYQWFARDGATDTPIFGAIMRTYTLTPNEVDKRIGVRLSYIDDRRTLESLDAVTGGSVSEINLPPTGAVTILGTLTTGEELTADTAALGDENGLPAESTFTYQWLADDTEISGATGRTYTLTPNELNRVITLLVRYTDGDGAAERVTSTPRGPVVGSNQAPTIGGTPVTRVAEDSEYRFTPQGMDADGNTLTYTLSGAPGWLSIDPVTGELTGTPTNADVGDHEGIVISVTDGIIAAPVELPAFDITVTNTNDAPTGGVTITGSLTMGGELTADTSALRDDDGLPAESTFTYQWLANGEEISGATLRTYTPTQDEVDQILSVLVRYTDDGGAAESLTSTPRGPVVNANDAPTIEGTPATTVAEDSPYNFKPEGGDVDGNVLTYAISGAPGWADFNPATGELTGTPTNDDVGTTTGIVISVTDGIIAAPVELPAFDLTVTNTNDAPTGAVTISGILAAGEELTADTSTLADDDGLPEPSTFTYQWLADGVEIPGATLRTYTLPPDEVGQTISLVVRYTDLRGSEEEVTSTPPGRVNTPPTIGGTPATTVAEDSEYSFTPVGMDVDDDDTLTYTISGAPGWLSIDPATGALTGTPTNDDVGTTTGIVVGVTDGIIAAPVELPAFDLSVTNVNDPPTGAVTIGGILAAGAELTADTSTLADDDGLPEPSTFTYQWLADGEEIPGATGRTYTLTPDEAGQTISLIVRYTDLRDSEEEVTSTPRAVNTPPTIGGTPATTVAEDSEYSFTPVGMDVDVDATLVYAITVTPAWANFDPTTGALTGTPGNDDVGTTTGIVISVTDGIAAPVELPAFDLTVTNTNDPPTGAVTIDGILTEDEVLTANTSALADDDGLPDESTFTYQWLANFTPITGATGRTYTLTQAEVGKSITLTVRYTDLQGVDESLTSLLTEETVRNADDPTTGLPTVMGFPFQGRTLRVDTSGLMDEDGLGTFTYQWVRDDVDDPAADENGLVWVDGATDSTYIPTQDDVDHFLFVVVTHFDPLGGSSEVSAFAGGISNINDLPTGELRISGGLAVGQTLSADTSALVDIDGLPEPSTFTYQWLANGLEIPGATGPTYTLTLAEVGQTISLVVRYTDLQGSEEEVTSAPLGPVVDANSPPTIGGTPATTVAEGSLYNFTPEGGDMDGNTLIYTIDNRPAWADFDSATGALTGTPTNDDVGTTTGIVIGVTDGIIAAPVELPAFDLSVTDTNNLPTGAVTIDGILTEDEVLTANTSALADADGLPEPSEFTYQWLADGVQISGATLGTYRLTPAEAGRFISVTVRYTDDDGANESLTSTPRGLVGNVNDPPTGAVTIRGILTAGEQLTADTSALADADGLPDRGTFIYRWIARSGATDRTLLGGPFDTYTLTADEVDAQISVTVSYFDFFDTAESLTSEPRGPVKSDNSPPTIGGTPATTVAEDSAYNFTPEGGDADAGDTLVYAITVTPDWADFDPATGALTNKTGRPGNDDVGTTTTGIVISVTDGTIATPVELPAFDLRVTNVNDVPTGAVTIIGTLTMGEVLTADTSTLADDDGLPDESAFRYTWQADFTTILNATARTYTLTPDEVGKRILVIVRYTDGQGGAETLFSELRGPVVGINSPPTISGVPATRVAEDSEYNFTPGGGDADGGDTLTYTIDNRPAWADFNPATGALTGTPGNDDVGDYENILISVTDGIIAAPLELPAFDLSVTNVNDPATGTVTIGGIPVMGEELTAEASDFADDDGLPDESEFRYTWQADGEDISGATDPTYTLTPAEVGQTISVVVEFTDDRNTVERVTSTPLGPVVNANSPPTIIGIPDPRVAEDSPYNFTPGGGDADGNILTYTIDNRPAWANFDPATGALTGTPTNDDVGTTTGIVISVTDGIIATPVALPAFDLSVTNTNDPVTGAVTINGILTEDEVLTANTSTLADDDGLPDESTFSYQWNTRDGATDTPISGATGRTYTLTQSEVGKPVTLTVSFTDDRNAPESRTSDATQVVTNINDAPTGRLRIDGLLAQNEVLTANTAALADEDGLPDESTFTYQWFANDGTASEQISGANMRTYTLTRSEAGKNIVVEISYQDLQGGNETVRSGDSFGPVARVNILPMVSSVPPFSRDPDSPTIFRVSQGEFFLITYTFTDPDGDLFVPSVFFDTSRWLVPRDLPGHDSANGNPNGNPTLTLSGTPGSADVGTRLEVENRLDHFENGRQRILLPSFFVEVIDNNAPTISGSPAPTAARDSEYRFAPGGGDADGDTLTYAITVTPDWASFDPATGTLTGTPTGDDVGTTTTGIVISVTDGIIATPVELPAFDLTVTNVNDPATGEVTIRGVLTMGEELTAEASDFADDDGLPELSTFTYQWLANGVEIPGATGRTYTLTPAEVGQTISVVVRYTDLRRNDEEVTSAPRGPVADANSAPTIGGTPDTEAVEDSAYNFTPEGEDADGDTLTYMIENLPAWASFEPATGALTGTPGNDDVGMTTGIVISVTDGIIATPVELPAFDLTVTNTNDPATGRPGIEVGTSVRTPFGGGERFIRFTALPELIVDEDGLPEEIYEEDFVTQPVRPFTYQWNRHEAGVDTAIPGETSKFYDQPVADFGDRVTLTVVSFTDLRGGNEGPLTSAPASAMGVDLSATGEVTIDGDLIEDQTLTANTETLGDPNGLPDPSTFTYVWRRQPAGQFSRAIPGATSNTYVLTQADVGARIRVIVHYTDLEGFAGNAPPGDSEEDVEIGVASIFRGPVANLSHASTGGVSITNADGEPLTGARGEPPPAGVPPPAEDQMLTADASAIEDADGLPDESTFTYQWNTRDGATDTPIPGATGRTYTLTQSEVGKPLTLRVSFIDGDGTEENQTSAATAAVTNVNDLPTGAVTIDGILTDGAELTANISALEDEDGLPAESEFEYEWRANFTPITNAPGRTYTLTQAEVGKSITLTVRYTDLQGGNESLTSLLTEETVRDADDPTTGTPVIIGDSVQGQTLTADTSAIMDEDGLGSFTYGWFRNGQPPPVSTERTYTLVQADVGTVMVLTVAHTDAQGTRQNLGFVSTVPIANINDLPTGELRISGGLVVGQTLSADTSTLVDIDGLPDESGFSYQWRADGVDITDATESEYLLTAARIGAQISLNLRYTDNFEADESITSPARGPVRGGGDNTPPTSSGLTVMTDEDTPHTFAEADFPFSDGDTDDSLQAVRIDSLPVPASLGELGLNGAALSAGQVIASGAIANLVYTPVANASGSASFTFSVSDGTAFSTPPANAAITVAAVEDVPTTSGLAVTTDEDTDYTFAEADFTFSHGDGNSLQAVRIDSLPTRDSLGELRLNGAAVSAGQVIAAGAIANLVYTPALNASGSLSFTFSVSDGTVFSTPPATASVTVTPVNDPPTITGNPRIRVTEDLSYNFTPVGADVDGDPLVYAITNLPSWASFDTATGALTGTPANADIGNYPDIIISVTDGIITTPLDTFAIEVIPHGTNNPPTTAGLRVTTAEDTPYTFREADFPFSDLDAGDRLQAVIIRLLPDSASGSLTLGGEAVSSAQLIEVGEIGTLVFTPAANVTGFVSFAYGVYDGEDSSATSGINIFITPVNDPPTTSDLAVTTAEDTPYTFAVADFPFTDVDSLNSLDSLQAVRIDSLPASADGSLALGTGTGATPVNMAQVIAVADIPTLVYTPVTNVNGDATFTFSVSDGTVFSAPPATATLSVSAVNDPPTISGLPDKTVVQGEDYSFTPGGSDVDGDTLVYAITNMPGWATFSTTTGALTGTPASTDVANYENIVITVTDNIIATPVALGAFAIAVTATAGTNMPPTANAGANQRVSKGTEVTLDGTGSSDSDGDNLNYLWSQDAGPTVTLSSTAAPQPTFTVPNVISSSSPASYTFSLVVSDGQTSSTNAATVRIFIRPLFRTSIANQTYSEGNAITPLTLPEALAGPGSLPSTNTYTLTPTPLPAGLAFNATSRILSGTPTSVGTFDLTYTATNQVNDTDSLSFSIEVTTPPNNPPTTSGLNVNIDEDTSYTFAVADFSFSDLDAGDSLQAVRIDSLPASDRGSLALGTGTSATAVSPGQVIEVGEIGTLVFTPAANFTGFVPFEYSVSDGEDFSSISLVIFTVTAVNDPPTTSAFTVTTAEDTPYTFGLADFSFADVEGDSLQAVRIATLPDSANGSLALGTGTGATPVNMAQVIAVADIPTLVYTPVANVNGDATFTFSLSDGTDFSTPPATTTVSVTAVNDAPTISGLPDKTGVQGAAYSFTPGGGDVDGDTLVYAISNLPDWADFSTTTGALTNKANRPNSTDVGITADIIISVTDNIIATPVALGAFAIEVTATAGTNMPPTADAGANQRVSKGTEVTLNGTGSNDPDGDNANLIYLWERTAGPTEVTLSSTTAPQPTFTIPTLIPTTGPDSYTFSLVVSDGQASSAAATVRIFIRPLFLDTIANQSFSTGNAITPITLPEAREGPDLLPSTNTYRLAPLPAGLAFNAASRILSGTPTSVGTFNLTYTATNGDGDTDSLSFAIEVTPNNPPTIKMPLTVTTDEDTPHIFAAGEFNFSDLDASDSLQRVRIDSLPASASGSLALGGTPVNMAQEILVAGIPNLMFTPVANFNGDATFRYSVSDGDDFSATATATVSVVNNPPTTSGLAITTDEDIPHTFAAADFPFADVDTNDMLEQVRIDTLPATGSLTLDGTEIIAMQEIDVADINNGNLIYTPAANVHGTDSFTFSVSDGTDFSTPATATITIDAVNDAPTGLPTISGTATEGQTLTADTSGIEDDDGPDPLLFTYQWNRNDGTTDTAISDATSATYTLTQSDVGEVITVTVSYQDGGGNDESLTSAPTEAVANVNDEPTGLPIISGTATEDETLTADTSGIEDDDGPDPLPFTYQWNRNDGTTDTAISDATSATYTLTQSDVGEVITVTVSYQDGGGNDESLTSAPTEAVGNVNDEPTGLPIISGTATEDETLTADTSGIEDDDGPDTLSFTYQWNRNDGTTDTAISDATSATYTLTQSDVGEVITLTVSYQDGGGNDESLTSAPTEAVAAAITPNTPPTSSGLDVTLDEDGSHTFAVAQFNFADTDSGDSLDAVRIDSLPASTNGSLTLNGTAVTLTQEIAVAGIPNLVYTPVANVNGAATFTFSVSDGTDFSTPPATATLTVTPVNDAPTITGTPATMVMQGVAYSFMPDGADVDTGDTLVYAITNMPSWASFSTATGALTGTPANADVGDYEDIVISVTDGIIATPVELPAFAIAVTNTNDAPTLSGTPATSVAEDSAYSFTPTGEDADGDTLTWAITNMPSWASFDTATGALTGTPTNADVGTTTDIVITVRDRDTGGLSASLPAFSIEVTNVNDAPTITGTPATTVAEDSAYSFTPTAEDADGDMLTYAITNMPSWASFDTATGALTGTPTNADVGNYENIVISVTDGIIATPVALPTFAIAVTNTNDAPTISGTPATTVAEDSLYTFTPTGEDGTPANADVGTTTDIVITVRDRDTGGLSASLPAFSIDPTPA